MPEFLENRMGIDLGTRSDGRKVSEVLLPPWSKGDPKTFVKVMRDALESEFVSANIHNWIDLIFGYKQRDKEAVNADNVFYYMSYEGAFDIEAEKDPLRKKSLIDHIQNFGQCPAQLLAKPHPHRNPPKSPMLSTPSSPNISQMFTIRPRPAPGGNLGIVFTRYVLGQVWILYEDGLLVNGRFTISQDGKVIKKTK